MPPVSCHICGWTPLNDDAEESEDDPKDEKEDEEEPDEEEEEDELQFCKIHP